jgi:hypothetical protein
VLIPLLGFVVSAALFAALGAALLRVTGLRRVRPLLLGAFVAAGMVGALAYAAVYGALVAGPSRVLESRGAVIGLLAGLPIVGTVTGWLVTRALGGRLG